MSPQAEPRTSCRLHQLLNDENLAEVLRLLPVRDQQTAHSVCRRWHDILKGRAYPVYGQLAINLDNLHLKNFARFSRWVGSRTGSIRSLILRGYGGDRGGASHSDLLQAYLGYLTGQLSTGPMSLEIEFAGEESILGLGCFQQAPFLELLSPVLTALRLPDLRFRLGEGELAALGQLRQLQELNIYVGSNGDTGGPFEEAGIHGSFDAAAQLTSLKSLALWGHSHLQRLPMDLGRLQQLRLEFCPALQLDLRALSMSSCLRELYLAGCAITNRTFSGGPSSWPALQSLSLLTCKISDDTFVTSWSARQHLTYIRIFSSGLTRVPAAMLAPPALRSLEISGAKLQGDWMPPCCSLLISMQVFAMQRCKVQHVPVSLCAMRTLTDIDLRDNHLSSLPEAMSRLTGLQKLLLGGNSFALLPEVLSVLTSLREIGLGHQKINPGLRITQPLDPLCELPFLQRLDIMQYQGFDHVSQFHISRAVARLQRQRRSRQLTIEWDLTDFKNPG